MNFQTSAAIFLILGSIASIQAQESTPADATPPPDAISVPGADAAMPSPSATDSKKAPVDMFQQDYDEEKDIFLIPNTQTPYNGPVFSVDENGAKESEGELKDGRHEGLWTEYNEDGTKSSEGVYRAGNKEGAWKYWFENAQLSSEGSYSEGKFTGLWKNYFEDGKLKSSGVFVHGEREGIWTIVDEETGRERTANYKNGISVP